MTKKKKERKTRPQNSHPKKKNIDEWLTTVIVIHSDQAFNCQLIIFSY